MSSRNDPAAAMGRGLLIASISLALALPLYGQRGDLGKRLKELNVRHTTAHYVLAGTVTDARLREYGQALEWIHGEYARGFAGLLTEGPGSSSAPVGSRPPAEGTKPAGSSREGGATDGPSGSSGGLSITEGDKQGRFRVIVLAARHQYDQFAKAFLDQSAEHTNGMYLHAHQLLLVLDQGNPDDTYETLFHEAFHQFLRRYVSNPPMWLNEGLATHFGSARPARDGVVFSRPPTARWKLVRELIEDRKAIPLADVIHADRRQFYDRTPIRLADLDGVTRKHACYAEAYTLVHMLLNKPQARQRLHDYIRDLAADESGDAKAITEKHFDRKTCDSLASHWVEYVHSRPETRSP